MRPPKENFYFISLQFFREILKKTSENMRWIFFGTKGEKSGIIYSMFHHILVTGPAKFQSFPTAITLGRAIFSPFILLFKQSQGGNK